MKIVIAIVILALLVHDDAALFHALHAKLLYVVENNE